MAPAHQPRRARADVRLGNPRRVHPTIRVWVRGDELVYEQDTDRALADMQIAHLEAHVYDIARADDPAAEVRRLVAEAHTPEAISAEMERVQYSIGVRQAERRQATHARRKARLTRDVAEMEARLQLLALDLAAAVQDRS